MIIKDGLSNTCLNFLNKSVVLQWALSISNSQGTDILFQDRVSNKEKPYISSKLHGEMSNQVVYNNLQ